MALLAKTAIAQAGAARPALTAAAAGGDTFKPGDDTYFIAANGSGGSITVTIDSLQLSNFGTDKDIVAIVPAGQTWEMGPFPNSRFRNANGVATVSYSGVTTLTVGVRRLPRA